MDPFSHRLDLFAKNFEYESCVIWQTAYTTRHLIFHTEFRIHLLENRICMLFGRQQYHIAINFEALQHAQLLQVLLFRLNHEFFAE